ncbi:MAG: hypothetical protein AB1403_15560 [Candidatus Riflebacteria bacterium]
MLETRTIIFCNSVMLMSMASLMIVYSIRQKVYPGFFHWFAGTMLAGIAYLAMGCREKGLFPEQINVLLTNLVVFSSAYLRVLGSGYFFCGQKVSNVFLIFSLILFSSNMYFLFVAESFLIRTVIMSVYLLCGLAIIGWYSLKPKTVPRSTFLAVFSLVNLSMGLFAFFRAVTFFFTGAQGMLSADSMNQSFFIFYLFSESILSASFIVLNSTRLESELRSAQDEVKILEGLLPICSSCKKIRNNAGVWFNLEHYISENSSAKFSHGICPSCSARLYPEYHEDEERK